MLAQVLIDLSNQRRCRFLSVELSLLIKSHTDIAKHQQSEVMLMKHMNAAISKPQKPHHLSSNQMGWDHHLKTAQAAILAKATLVST